MPQGPVRSSLRESFAESAGEEGEDATRVLESCLLDDEFVERGVGELLRGARQVVLGEDARRELLGATLGEREQRGRCGAAPEPRT